MQALLQNFLPYCRIDYYEVVRIDSEFMREIDYEA